MQKPVTCNDLKCGKQFFVTVVDDLPYVGEGHLDVACPHCSSSNRITWPMGRFPLVTKNK